MILNKVKGNLGASVREEQLEGRPHLVRPVVILVEGVHCGSGGCLMYQAKDLAASTNLWNGMPVPIYHPERNGEAVSANTPEVLSTQVVGRLFNMRFENKKLAGEIWLDVNKAMGIAPSVLDAFRNGDVIEVSTGLYSNDEMSPGRWGNEDYIGTVRNIRPDHLALLPGVRGACSVEDGCGVRVNQGQPEPFVVNDATEVNLAAIPKDTTVRVKAVRGRTGEEIVVKQNAAEFLADNEARSERYRQLLERLSD